MKARNILLIVGILGLAVVILTNLHQLSDFIKLASHINPYVVVAVIAVQLSSYYLNGLYYRSILHVFGYQLPVKRLFEGALAANFVNYIVPTAGAAGAAFLSQVLQPEVPRGEGVLTQITRYALSALAVLLMLPVGILLVAVGHHESHTITKVAIVSTLLILALAIITVLIVNREKLLRRYISWLGRQLGRLTKKDYQAALDRFLNDFYRAYYRLVKAKGRVLVPFAWSIAYIVAEVLTVYLAFLAFGKVVNPGIAIMGYLLANIASVLGGTFFSIGVFELGMLGTFVALGVPFTVAFSVTLVYRALNLLIGLPPGLYYYRKYLRSPS